MSPEGQPEQKPKTEEIEKKPRKQVDPLLKVFDKIKAAEIRRGARGQDLRSRDWQEERRKERGQED